MPHADATVAAVREVVRRTAPWLHLYLGPRLWSVVRDGEDVSAFRDVRRLPDGRVVHGLGGQAWVQQGIVLVSGWSVATRGCRYYAS